MTQPAMIVAVQLVNKRLNINPDFAVGCIGC